MPRTKKSEVGDAPKVVPFSADERMQLRADNESLRNELNALKANIEIPKIVANTKLRVYDEVFVVSEIDAANSDRYIVMRLLNEKAMK